MKEFVTAHYLEPDKIPEAENLVSEDEEDEVNNNKNSNNNNNKKTTATTVR